MRETPARPTIEIGEGEADALLHLTELHPNGVVVKLGPGEFAVDRTIRLPSRTEISGCGPERTRLTLKPRADCHLLSNADHARGNKAIVLEGFSVAGNAAAQERPDGHRYPTYACGVYFMNVRSLRATNLAFSDIRQTALHLSLCEGVEAVGIKAEQVGWSGISAMRISNAWIEAVVRDSGRDIMHSAFHIDGGFGLRLCAVAQDSTGNGIMLDTVNGALRNVALTGSASRCKRGVALVGSKANPIENVLIEGTYSDNRETGVLISNASHVVLAHGQACRNGETGVRFRGESGATDCLLCDFEVSGNPRDFRHGGASRMNWIAHMPGLSRPLGSWGVNARTLKEAFGDVYPWQLPDGGDGPDDA